LKPAGAAFGWSLLIVRDVWVGIRRFDELQRSLGLSRRALAARLQWLCDHGVLERRPYSERPPRDEYLLTLIEIVAQVRSALALRRLATVDEVAGACLHLMVNGFVTGQVLAVDGGVMLAK
jgi:hypothetical protein